MIVIKARDLVNLTREQIWARPEGKFLMECEDAGKTRILVNRGSTIFSWYAWEFHRKYPETPVLPDHHIGLGQFSSGLPLKLLSNIMFEVYDTHIDVHQQPMDLELLCKMAYEIANQWHNETAAKLGAYVVSLDAMDYLDALAHPAIKEANENVRPNPASINGVYSVIDQVLKGNDLPGCRLSEAAKLGTASMGQINQSIGPRGFHTDIDSGLFPKPVLNSYAEGIVMLGDSMQETCSASKALMFAKDPLADTEYFNREMQLATDSLQYLYYHCDCGSENYIAFDVRQGDLKQLSGKYILKTEEIADVVLKADRRKSRPTMALFGTNHPKLHRITMADNGLIGKRVYMRSPLGCNCLHMGGICATCMGELSMSVPYQTNLGHVSITHICEKISQRVLSTKHLDGSSEVDPFQICGDDVRFINNKEHENLIFLNKELSKGKVKIVIDADEARQLTDILHVDNVCDLSLERISQLREIQIFVDYDDGETEAAFVKVSMGGRLSALSHDMLEYLAFNSWSLDIRGDYVIEMDKWDYKNPILELPLRHVNMLEFMKTIESFVKMSSSRRDVQRHIQGMDDMSALLTNLFSLISSKLRDVNLAHMEVILAATLIRDSASGDYSFPVVGGPCEIGAFNANMQNRSMGPAMAHEGHLAALTSASAFLNRDRMPHPIDALVKD